MTLNNDREYTSPEIKIRYIQIGQAGNIKDLILEMYMIIYYIHVKSRS
jgi:hypothetical protein